LYTSLNDSDEQAIRRKIGIYYKLFTKPTQDDIVHFSVPYIGSQGLGKEHIRISSSSFYLNQATKSININKRHTDRQIDSKKKKKKQYKMYMYIYSVSQKK